MSQGPWHHSYNTSAGRRLRAQLLSRMCRLEWGRGLRLTAVARGSRQRPEAPLRPVLTPAGTGTPYAGRESSALALRACTWSGGIHSNSPGGLILAHFDLSPTPPPVPEATPQRQPVWFEFKHLLSLPHELKSLCSVKAARETRKWAQQLRTSRSKRGLTRHARGRTTGRMPRPAPIIRRPGGNYGPTRLAIEPLRRMCLASVITTAATV
jgi:hypothetical protein